MECSTSKRKTFAQPRPLNDLLSSLSGICTQDVQQTRTDKKQPRPVRPQPLTADRVMKPMTISALKANLIGLTPLSPRTKQPMPASHRKDWVSSIKVDYKSVSHTANGQLRNHPVRKVLNFQAPKAKATTSRTVQQPAETPKFPKPESRAKKSVYAQARTNAVRISGICEIPETPVETQTKPVKSRLTIANKENNPYQSKLTSAYRPNLKQKENLIKPKPVTNKPMPKIRPLTPVNSSWKSNDASFLQKEQEIEKMQLTQCKREVLREKPLALTPSSTPFKGYRSFLEYFNNSNEAENSAVYSDNTIMSFEKDSKENSKREESVIVSLCDLFTKATVNTDKFDADLDALLEMKEQTEGSIKMIESGIHILNNIKQTQIESLQRVEKLIKEHRRKESESEMDCDKTVVEKTEFNKTLVNGGVLNEKLNDQQISPVVSIPASVFKSHAKSPTYKIPKKNMSSLRKKLAYKSMPNVSSTCLQTPVKDFGGPALNVYMEMKQQLNFLSTPTVNRIEVEPDTPMITSHNLQKQLDKLYNGS